MSQHNARQLLQRAARDHAVAERLRDCESDHAFAALAHHLGLPCTPADVVAVIRASDAVASDAVELADDDLDGVGGANSAMYRWAERLAG